MVPKTSQSIDSGATSLQGGGLDKFTAVPCKEQIKIQYKNIEKDNIT